MSLKAKLFTTVAALCMVICLLTVGVWAAKKATVNVSGTVSFVAEDVYATVAMTTAGQSGTGLDKEVTFNFGTPNAEVDSDVKTTNEATETWKDLALTFNPESKEAIVFTFVVTNHGERAVKVTFTPNVATTANFTLSEATEKITGTTALDDNGNIPAGGSATYTMTMAIKDANTAFTGVAWAIDVVLDNVPNA